MYKQQYLSPEAKARKQAYIGQYNKAIYKSYTLKLRKEEDADLIEAIKKSGLSVCALAKLALQNYLKPQK